MVYYSGVGCNKKERDVMNANPNHDGLLNRPSAECVLPQSSVTVGCNIATRKLVVDAGMAPQKLWGVSSVCHLGSAQISGCVIKMYCVGQARLQGLDDTILVFLIPN